MLGSSRIIEAHEYVREMDNSFLDAGRFARQVMEFARVCHG